MEELKERRAKELAEGTFWSEPFIYFIAFICSVAIYIDSLKPEGFVNLSTEYLNELLLEHGYLGVFGFNVLYLMQATALYSLWVCYRRKVADNTTMITATIVTVQESIAWAFQMTCDVVTCRVCSFRRAAQASQQAQRQPGYEHEVSSYQDDESDDGNMEPASEQKRDSYEKSEEGEDYMDYQPEKSSDKEQVPCFADGVHNESQDKQEGGMQPLHDSRASWDMKDKVESTEQYIELHKQAVPDLSNLSLRITISQQQSDDESEFTQGGRNNAQIFMNLKTPTNE